MATIRNSQVSEVEDLHGRNAELETENSSLADDLAEARQENLELKAQISRLMSDRSMTV